MTHWRISDSWTSWRDDWADCTHVKRSIQKAAMRMISSFLAAGFGTWLEMFSWRREQQQCRQRAIIHSIIRGSMCGLKSWRARSVEIAQSKQTTHLILKSLLQHHREHLKKKLQVWRMNAQNRKSCVHRKETAVVVVLLLLLLLIVVRLK